MNESRTEKSGSYRGKRIALRVFFGVTLIVLVVSIVFRILLVTPLAADFVGKTLSRLTAHTVAVTGISLSGTTLYLNGITVQSPAGFTPRKMISAGSIALAPDLLGLVRGKRSLAGLELTGLKIDAAKNTAGDWNIAPLVQRFTEKKERPAAEFFIGHFVLRNGVLRINGREIRNLGLTLDDFSTRGTTDSKLKLSAKDSAGNPILVTAEGRLGHNPAFDVAVEAPGVSLKPLQQFLGAGSTLQLANSSAGLSLKAALHEGLLNCRVKADVRQMSLSLSGEALPITVSVELAAGYDGAADKADITHATLTIENIATIRATGSMQKVRNEGRFALRATPERIDLGRVAALLPLTRRQKLQMTGEITSRGFRLEGTRDTGITAASGMLSLRKAELVRGERLIISGGAADCSLEKSREGWKLAGMIFTEGKKDPPLIEALSVPFVAQLDSRFRPKRTDVPNYSARLAGIPIKGTFHYLDSAPEPFTINCSTTGTPLTTLNRFVSKWSPSTSLSSGRLIATAALAGKTLQNFKGTASLKISSAAGTAANGKLSLDTASIRSEIEQKRGLLSVAGSLQASGGRFGGKPFEAASNFTLDGRKLAFRKLSLEMNATRLHVESLSLNLPKQNVEKTGNRFPVRMALSGGDVRSGDIVATGINAATDCRYAVRNGTHQLVGTAEVSIPSLSYRKHPLASCTAKLTFDGRNAVADVRGKSLGGTLSAKIKTALFPTRGAVSASARLLDQHLERLAVFLPEKASPRITAGTADIALNGTYSRQNGVEGAITAAGRSIALKGSSGKTLASGIAAAIDLTVSGQTLTLRESSLSHAQGINLLLHGAMQHFSTMDRSGTLSFSMPSTPLNALLDVFANGLPRILQEAVCKGTCMLGGAIELNGAKTRINGELSLESATLEIPSQKVAVAGVNGRIPFSLAFPWSGTEPAHTLPSFSRENYPEILKTLSRPAVSEHKMVLEKVRFGALETGPVTFNTASAGGVIRVSPIEANLYDGKVRGNAYLLVKETAEYGANILLNDISLNRLCDSFPAIRGYISGRVDGIISLKNRKSGLKELTGYVNLWTRTGKGEKMLVSKEFLQKLAGKKLRGFFFTNDRPYDNGEVNAYLRDNYLTFEKLDISHTNFLGMKDLSVSVVPVQNRISLDHLLASIREAAARGKKGDKEEAPPIQTDLKWLE